MRFAGRVEGLKGTGAAAWDIHAEAMRARAAGAAVVAMSVGDPDLDTPAEVTEAAVRSLRGGETHYTPMRGIPSLRAAVAERFAAGGGPGANAVAVTAGAQNALFAACQILFGPGDRVILIEPAYATYEATVRAAGAEPVRVPARAADGFRPDTAAIAAAAAAPDVRGILLNNPANPTGVVLTEAELGAVADIARARDLTVISDEVYGALAFDRPHRPIASLAGMAERTVTVGSVSKSHAMTGWRVGWAIGPEAFADHFERLALAMLYGLPAFVQRAALAALERSDRIEAEMRAIYRRRCGLVADALEGGARIAPIRPEGGMFVMLDVTRTGLPALEFAWRLFREEGVAVLPGEAFGESAAGTVRLSCAIGKADLAEGARRIARFAGRLSAAFG